MEKQIKELISEYEIKLDTVKEVILNSDENESVLTAQAVERFLKRFLTDLRAIEALSIEARKSELKWLKDKTEKYSNRYAEAETFILEISKLKWYERIFCFGRIMKFLKSREKYNY